MKKRFIGICAAAVMTLALTVNAFAMTTDYSWNESYNNGSKIESTFSTTDFDAKLKNVQPGDTINMTANITNTSDAEMNWFLQNEVLKNLEEDQKAQDGAYSYVLTYTNSENESKVIYDSKTVGGDNGSGLSDATDALDVENGWIYLETMSTSDKATLTLSITLEGETINNSYQDSAARWQLQFGTEKNQGTTTVQTIKNLITGPKTGDTNTFMYSIIGLGAGIVLLLICIIVLKRRKKEEAQ